MFAALYFIGLPHALSGLPPFGMARAQRLYRSVRARFPHLRLMVGIWGYTDDLGKASQKISRGESVHISTMLADAVGQVRSYTAVEVKPVETAQAPSATAA